MAKKTMIKKMGDDKRPMTETDARKLEKDNPINKVALELGLRVKGSVGQCFNCSQEGNDDFSLFFNVAKNTFFCKNCPEIGGSVIDLVCQIKKWDRDKAEDWLTHREEFDKKTKDMFQFKGKKKFSQMK